jgi:hypothetical protein
LNIRVLKYIINPNIISNSKNARATKTAITIIVGVFNSLVVFRCVVFCLLFDVEKQSVIVEKIVCKLVVCSLLNVVEGVVMPGVVSALVVIAGEVIVIGALVVTVVWFPIAR